MVDQALREAIREGLLWLNDEALCKALREDLWVADDDHWDNLVMALADSPDPEERAVAHHLGVLHDAEDPARHSDDRPRTVPRRTGKMPVMQVRSDSHYAAAMRKGKMR